MLWSMIGTVDRIVVAPGKIATRTPMLVMQPFTTSRIIEIAVKAGDHVVKGQVLVRFDPAFAQADVASLRQKVRPCPTETQRLEAQLANAPFTAGPTTAPSAQPRRRSTAGNERLSGGDETARQPPGADRFPDPSGRKRNSRHPRQLDMAQKVVEMQDRLRQQKAARHWM